MKVSTSEALMVGSCERKYLYAAHPSYHLEPKSYGVAISRGIIGHEILQQYFERRMKGDNHDTAKNEAMSYGASMLATAMLDDENMAKVDILTELLPLIGDYFNSDKLIKFMDEVIIIGVEYAFNAYLPNGTVLPGRIDLIVKYEKGSFKGEIVPVDHKFVYNFWSENDLRMNSQFPNYIYALRQEFPDEVIARGIVNMLRWRSNAVEKFSMIDLPKFSRSEINEIIDNHIGLADKAKRIYELPYEEAHKAKVVSRTLSKYSCGNCQFNLLCKAELTGTNTANLIAMEYKPNTYGYDKADKNDE